MPILTAFTAALLALLLVVLSFRVVFRRRALKVAIGSANDKILERRIRAHSNFTEYTPFALLLIAFNEMANLSAYWVGLLCLLLLIGRCLHAYSVSSYEERTGKVTLRVRGMYCTLLSILLSVTGILYVSAKAAL